jgi:D-beta-D-heptose 7-phosphate kinase/D-beta-D-heptose 1-phosphate adenosyltransferase
MNMTNIAVVGDLILDHYIFGEATRLSPEAPIPIVKGLSEVYILGGACNVVRNLKSFGSNVELFGIIGQDTNGFKLLEMLSEIGVKHDNVLQVLDRPTTFKSRIQVGNQQIVRVDKEVDSGIPKDVETKILYRFSKNLSNIDLVIISDYAKGLLTISFLNEIIKLCKNSGIRILVDPKGSDFSKYKGVFLSTPNKLEASLATGINIDNQETLGLAMNKLTDIQKTDHQIVTMGADGIAYSGFGNIKVFPALANEVYDVTGAGDTVIAALGFCIATGLSIESSIEFANKAASIVIQKRGSATTTIEEVENLHNPKKENVKIFYNANEIPKDLLNAISKSKVVFTNGCFDILHSGHVSYLQNASKLGELLIIGLNSDISIRKIKGQDRPIINERDRSIVLSAIGFVDYVILFDDPTPIELIKLLKPQVLVKGGDYKKSDVVGNDIANETVIMPFVEGKSTSEIIRKIKFQE